MNRETSKTALTPVTSSVAASDFRMHLPVPLLKAYTTSGERLSLTNRTFTAR